jgi:hypothetical protein
LTQRDADNRSAVTKTAGAGERAAIRKGDPPRRPLAGSRNKRTLAAAVLLEGEGEAARIAGVVDTFVRVIETSDFERRLKIVEGETPLRAVKMPEMFGTGLGGQFNP